MVTIELSKPKKIDLGLPDLNIISCGIICGENRSMTLLLGDYNQIISYTGILESPIHAPKSFNYGQNGIRNEIVNYNKQVLKYSTNRGTPDRGMTVIIKPSKKCNFKNLVDVLDEMTINKIDVYTIVNDFTPEEQNLLNNAKI